MHPAKLLLFGEYTILLGSDALAIPFDRFNGEFAFKKELNEGIISEEERSNLILKNFLSFIIDNSLHDKLNSPFDYMSFGKDIAAGMYYKSDIPVGSGLGSSGALVAATYNKYTNQSPSETAIQEIITDLALLESFFHGKSSGIDPLASLLKSPLLLRKKEICELRTDRIVRTLREFGLFLVYSSKSSATGELVEEFRVRCNSDPGYLSKLRHKYIPLNNKCIRAVTESSDPDAFFRDSRELTTLQSEIFKEMIPESFSLLVREGLELNLFYTKLCGSGGGGYFMGFTKNMSETEEYFRSEGYRVIVF